MLAGNNKMVRTMAYCMLRILIFSAGACALPCYTQPAMQTNGNATSPDKLLLNGRIWMNQYSKVTGNQFFLSGEYLKGSVFIKGHRYDDLDLKYDICNDELVLKYGTWPVIFMNKELVDSFSLSFDKVYKIINTGRDKSSVFSGYVNLLYEGPTSLYVKFTKKVYPLGDNGLYDLFVEKHFVFLKKDGETISVSTRRKLLKLLGDKKRDIQHFIKSNGYRISPGKPETLVPVLEFYDRINK